ncbi:hypothetical protein PHMEG_0006700 [Phytophthora megakarya]|uniref:LamG-like jellyroll fold domain-containing protein n=1 Tax=Phytophthora megakarya TaxID=4795 RepID=A0A225WN93_9STRA|nr:hypothetical protein PHMEG_0006700 [Phytophthora megakarya]
MFTMDAWFSLSLATQSIKQGGVLFGLQNQECRNIGGRWSDFNCQILHVDGNRNLYCSVTDAKPCVAHQLETKRWYHVALVFEGQVQRIYLNGQLVDQQHNQNPQQLEWFPDWYAQVGTGFFYDGWYGFHGVVDHFRIWHEAMTADQIIVLGSDCATVLPRPEFSLKRDVSFAMAQGVEKVRCSRPRERWCEVVTAWKQTDEPECDVEQDVNRDVQAKTKCVPERGENTHQSNKCQGRRYKRKKKLGKRRALEREIKLGFNA